MSLSRREPAVDPAILNDEDAAVDVKANKDNGAIGFEAMSVTEHGPDVGWFGAEDEEENFSDF